MLDNKSQKGIEGLKLTWHELTLFDRFERVVMLFVSFILAVVILIALARFAENVYQLAIAQIVGKTEFKAFQVTFGMLLTLLIKPW